MDAEVAAEHAQEAQLAADAEMGSAQEAAPTPEQIVPLQISVL